MNTSFNFRQIRSIFGSAALIALTVLSFALVPESARMQNQIVPRIAFDRDGQVRTINADGSAQTALADGFDPAWSPDGAKIVYAYGAEAYSTDIYTMDENGANQMQLTQNGRSYAPVFSPVGGKIAFVSEHEGDAHIYTINADGTEQQRIFFAGDFQSEHAPSFSTDGSKIVFIGTTLNGNNTNDDYYMANADGTGVPIRLTFLGGFNRNPASVSPDGTNVLVSRFSDIYAVKTDGSGEMTNITASMEAEFAPDYSPDGTKIVFRRTGDGLMIMNADGSHITALNAFGDNPEWLPTANVEPTPTPTATPTATPTPVPTAPDLNVQVAASSQTTIVGGSVTFNIGVRNNGDGAASDVRVSSTALIAGEINRADYVSANAPGGCEIVLSGSTVKCNVGTLAPNQAATVQIVVKPNVAGNMLFNSSAVAVETDRNESDNTNFANVQIGAAAACAEDVTALVRVNAHRATRNPRTGEYEQLISAKNVSDQDLHPRAMFVFDNLTSAVSVAPQSLSGLTECAAPLRSQYVTANTNGGAWKPNQVITIRVTFTNPPRKEISYDLRVMAGANNP